MQSQELDKLIQQEYIPSASERKKSVMMYFLIGIIISLIKGVSTEYEKYHLKQAMWWWCVFFLFVVVSMFLIFIPYIRLLPIFIFILLLIIWWILLYQAIEGKYTIDKNKIFMPLFYWIGFWIYNLFDLEEEEKDNEDSKKNNL